jgi:hypothetical protein
MMPPPSRHPSSASGPPPKVVRFRDPVVQKQQPSRPQEITRRSSQPKKVHPVSMHVMLRFEAVLETY